LLRSWSIGLLPVVVLLVAVAVLTHRNSTDAGQTEGPVLLVAGYGGSAASLEALAAALKSAGRTVQIVPPVGDNTGDLRVQAQALQRAAQATGADSVDVVGYSAGGVVARIWVADLGGRALARRVVTLGSPHHGTDVAGLAAGLLPGGCPTACRQLAPGSDLLASLPETPNGPRWTSIWTADDDVVLPPTSARLQGAQDIELQQVCPGNQVKHSGLPQDPLTVALVERALDGPAPTTAPSASQCDALRNH
jgi:triacylglycerol esterase/lipase EstA (alpha/beta hydrolase family)